MADNYNMSTTNMSRTHTVRFFRVSTFERVDRRVS